MTRKIGEKEKGKWGENFIGGSVHRFTFPFLFIGGYGFSPSSTLSTATTITPITFQGRKPTLFRHPSSMDEVRSSNQVLIDEMDSSNPVNVFGSISSDQAKQVHPDKNPSDPLAVERSQVSSLLCHSFIIFFLMLYSPSFIPKPSGGPNLYNSGSDIDDFSSHWCPEADHPPSQDLRSVLMMIFPLQRGWI
ncbi:hypothetical protein CK203_034525 [Vitis vinifera]|uniref:Uncharacterized protein n=1 Tax=Vitis vinifera TaxID=29760 RepID=A0A438IDR0_VITVI|nr:hypothetical protein CK203_034525 [Vitis vinifera]